MRIAKEEYAAVCGSSEDVYAAVCGLRKKNMRQYADRMKTCMRQYADCERRVCGSMRIVKEEYAAICGSRCTTLIE